VIQVVSTGSRQGAETVNYATSDGTAQAGVRYQATSGTLSFNPGDTSQTFSIPILHNGPLPFNQTVDLQLSNPGGGATLGTQVTAVLTIHDDSTYVPLSTLTAANAVMPGGTDNTSLQYAPDGNLAQLFWIPNAQGGTDLTYVERSNFGDFRTEIVTSLAFSLSGGGLNVDVPATAQLLFDSGGTAHVVLATRALQYADGTIRGPDVEDFVRGGTGWHLGDEADSVLGTQIFDMYKMGMAAAIGPDNSLYVVLDASLYTSQGPSKNTPAELIYGTNQSGQWTFQKIADLGAYHGNGAGTDENPRDLSLAIDSHGIAHVAYTPSFDETPVAGTPYYLPFSQLAYATNQSGSWATQVVWQSPDNSGDAGLGESIAIGPGDEVAIASYFVERVSTGSAKYSELLYHTLTPTGWTHEVVASTSDGYAGTDGTDFTGFAPELVFDAQGDPNIVFSDHASSHFADTPGGLVYDHEYNGQIRFAVKQAGSWLLSTIVHQTNPLQEEMSFPELALGPNGAIAFSGFSNDPQILNTTYVLIDNDAVGQFRQKEAGVALAFTQSAENYSNFITASYQRYLQRAPDAVGLASWLSQMQHGLTDEQLEASLIASSEYITAHGGTNGQGVPGATWVQALYQDVLGRSADPTGLAAWTSQLAAGVSPYTIALGFTTSSERETVRINADYTALLDRPVDSNGLATWLSQLTQGVTQENIEAQLMASHEYFFGHGQGDEPHWVASLYQDILHRQPSVGEINSWIQVLGGVPIPDPNKGFQVHGLAVASAITQSQEYYGDVVAAAYQHYLKRAPDNVGLTSWVDQMQHGLTDEQLEASLIASNEYITAHGGTNSQGVPGAAWVQALYQDVLGRSADPTGLAAWETQLAAGVSPFTIALGFTTSGEREQARINADYSALLNRPADSNGLATWISQLAQGVTQETIEAELLASQEYFSNRGGGDATHWIGSVYQDILHRTASQAEINYWIGVLTH